jgi:gentisate 1,2-dioxygenase
MRTRTGFHNVGTELIESAGLSGIATLVIERSQLARLITEKFVADSGFVDGSHIFSQCLRRPVHPARDRSPRGIEWLDGSDLPLVAGLDAVFAEDYAGQSQEVIRGASDSTYRWASNIRPAYDEHRGADSPVLRYPFAQTRAALHAVHSDAGSPFDGVILEYINPYSGGPGLASMSTYLQLQRSGRAQPRTPPCAQHRLPRSSCRPGAGTSTPASMAKAVLLSFSDRPVIRALGFGREQILSGYQ